MYVAQVRAFGWLLQIAAGVYASGTSFNWTGFAVFKPTLASFRRIVVKVGSSLLVDAAAGGLKREWLQGLTEDIAALHRGEGGEPRDILVVSSGSIALGRAVLKLPSGALKLEEAQGAAAIGQIALARSWSEVMGAHGITAGQVLVT